MSVRSVKKLNSLKQFGKFNSFYNINNHINVSNNNNFGNHNYLSNFMKVIISSILTIGLFLGSISVGYAQNINYTVQPGDSFWIISQKYGVPLDRLMQANNANWNTILYIGQNIVIPTDYGITHTVIAGDTFWIISRKYGVDINKLMAYNNANENTILYIGQKIKIPQLGSSGSTSGQSSQSPESTKPYITYSQYTVQKGDILWNIAIKFGIPLSELLKVNNLTESSAINIGKTLKIPVHHVPVKATPEDKYGEYLDWWTEAQYVVPVGSQFEIVDFYTGKSFKAKRTTGANHADCEALTVADSNIMKAIWGGNFSWVTRPVIIKYSGRKIAASVSSMPHAGNDNAPGGVYTSWRSGNYGAGYNLDWVKGNGMNGVFDVHFSNSTRHSDGKIDLSHQKNIKIAAGVK